VEGLGDFATSKDLDTVELAADEFFSAEEAFVDGCASFEALFEGVEIDDTVDRLELGVVKAALGQAAEEGHLAAFEAGAQRAARAGFLTLVAFAGGFSVAGAFAYTEAFAAVLGSLVGF